MYPDQAPVEARGGTRMKLTVGELAMVAAAVALWLIFLFGVDVL
jgi:hypothetical protein